MPVYDYQCKHCQAAFEVRVSFKEKEAGLKPEYLRCHSQETRQVLTAGLLLHGSKDGAAPKFPICGPNSEPGCCG